jgi:hypothetical protein
LIAVGQRAGGRERVAGRELVALHVNRAVAPRASASRRPAPRAPDRPSTTMTSPPCFLAQRSDSSSAYASGSFSSQLAS